MTKRIHELAPLDKGVRLVSATGQVEYDDDPTLPFRVYVNLRPPEFMRVTFCMLHGGSEEIVARAETLEWAEGFIRREDLEGHPRFNRLEITGPDGLKIERQRGRR